MRSNQHKNNELEGEAKAKPRYRFSFKKPSNIRRLTFAFADWFSINLEREIRLAEPLVWLTCLFLLGVALYFAAPNEPHLPTLLILLAGTSIIFVVSRTKGARFYGVAAIFSLLSGFTIAALHTAWSDPSIIDRDYRVHLEGSVADYEKRADGSKRIVVNEINVIEGRERLTIPKRIRVRVLAKSFTAKPGNRLKFRAQIGPPPGPVMPGGYDFARDMFFKGIGATGFVYGTPEIVSDVQAQSFLLHISPTKWRAAISNRISNAFSANAQAQYQGVAAALLVGEKGNIEPEIREAFIASGLAHILAISGLHMALVMTFVIFAARAVLALNSRWSLQYSIKNIAIYAGLVTGFFYFLLSGGSVSATRAFIMVSIMALAMLFGRRALSVRNIALACLFILALTPFALIGPGFQMSFSATLCLVAFASYWIGRGNANVDTISWPKWMVFNLKRYFLGLIITSLIAGAATGLFAAFHFHRIAPLGLAANILGVPIFALFVMPFGFFGLLLMPFGYEALPFWVMGQAIEVIVWIAKIIALYSNAYAATGALNSFAFLMLSALLILLCILKSHLRLLLIPFFVLGVVLLPNQKKPNLLIAEDGKTVALHLGEGEMLVSGARAGRFEQKVWRSALGLHESTKADAKKGAPTCDKFGCIFSSQKLLIAHVTHTSAFYEDCRRADIVISEFSAPEFCKNTALVIDRKRLKSGGSQSVFFKPSATGDDRFVVQSSIPLVKRPWHRHYQQAEK